jgi:hypothetical protein
MKFVLVDTNENYFNCGHYPEWEVREVDGEIDPRNTTRRGTPLEYGDRETAEAAAARMNAASSSSWHVFLND